MRVGQKVSFIDSADVRHTATITEIAGTGKSLFKKLNVEYRGEKKDVIVEDVPHENDAEVGDEFWIGLGVKRKSEEQREDEGVLVAEPIVADGLVLPTKRGKK